MLFVRAALMAVSAFVFVGEWFSAAHYLNYLNAKMLFRGPHIVRAFSRAQRVFAARACNTRACNAFLPRACLEGGCRKRGPLAGSVSAVSAVSEGTEAELLGLRPLRGRGLRLS